MMHTTQSTDSFILYSVPRHTSHLAFYLSWLRQGAICAFPRPQIHPQQSSLGLSARFRLENWMRFLLRQANRYRLLHENELVAKSTCSVYRPLERQRGPIRDLPLKLPLATHSISFRQLAIDSEETTRSKVPRSSSGCRRRRADVQSTSMTKPPDDEDSSGQTDRLPAGFDSVDCEPVNGVCLIR